MEADAGWLVLTHGVGPMRTYRIGAILLDLDNPKRILGQLRQQLLCLAPDQQDGYVPNVFYSCEALVYVDIMLRTYGIGDAAIGVATVSLPELLDALSPSPTRPRWRTTLYVNNVDIASSRAFTGGLARKPLSAAMRIPLGINGFPFYPGIIGSRPLHDADARRNTGTHTCAHSYRGTTTAMKNSDPQRRNTLSENVIHVGTGFVAKKRPHVVEVLSTLGPPFVTRDLFPERSSRWGGMTR